MILSSDLDGHLIVLPGGETAIQTVDGNVVLRLQLDKSGNAVLYGSPDGGATWPTSETVITNADLPLSAKTYQIAGSANVSFTYDTYMSCVIFINRGTDISGLYLCDSWSDVAAIKTAKNVDVTVSSSKSATIQNNNSVAVNVLVLMVNNS